MILEILDQIIWSYINNLPNAENLSKEEKDKLYNDYKIKMFNSTIDIKYPNNKKKDSS